MLYTEISVRDNVRNRDGKRMFYLGKGDTLTAGARDWLLKERIEILPAQKARPDRFSLMGGGFLEEKPEHMTHLNAQILVPKTHPRIAFRGSMDTLESVLILAQLAVSPEIREKLQQVLELARKILRWDVLEEPAEEGKLCGLTRDELRAMSHRPQEYFGTAHFMPDASLGAAMAWLNRARCAAREAELRAVAAFSDREGNPTRPDLLQALNRMSSMLYILMIEQKGRG